MGENGGYKWNMCMHIIMKGQWIISPQANITKQIYVCLCMHSYNYATLY